MQFVLQQFTLPSLTNRKTVPAIYTIKWRRNKVCEHLGTQFSPLKNISKALCGSPHKASGPQGSFFRCLHLHASLSEIHDARKIHDCIKGFVLQCLHKILTEYGAFW